MNMVIIFQKNVVVHQILIGVLVENVVVVVTFNEILVRFTSSYFCAGAIFDEFDHKCIDAAPIINWMKGNSVEYIFDYAKRKKWKIEIIKPR